MRYATSYLTMVMYALFVTISEIIVIITYELAKCSQFESLPFKNFVKVVIFDCL